MLPNAAAREPSSGLWAGIIHRSEDRAKLDLGWLQVRSTFRPSAHQAERQRFGALVTLDDTVMVAGGKGFGMHPHQDLDLITLVLSGQLHHRDSQGRDLVIEAGQAGLVMAGNGIRHAEFNHSDNAPVELLQLIVMPSRKGMAPRFDVFPWRDRQGNNRLVTVLPDPEVAQPPPVAFALSVGSLQAASSAVYRCRAPGRAAYVFVISGELEIAQLGVLRARDGAGLIGWDAWVGTALSLCELLVIEVPTGLN